MRKLSVAAFVPAAILLSSAIAGPVFGQETAATAAAKGPTAVAPYEVSVFATGIPGEVDRAGFDRAGGQSRFHRVWRQSRAGWLRRTEHPGGGIPAGYRRAGAHLHGAGHRRRLKLDPCTGLLWALQNEDADANLVIINTVTQQTKEYKLGTSLNGGGYDDIVFRGGKVYLSASNPQLNPNTGPAIVTVELGSVSGDVKTALAGDASAIDLPTDATVQLNLQDPDSMTTDPLGNIVLDSQGDQELIIVSNPGASNQRVLHLPLTYHSSDGVAGVEVDDTNFATSTSGYFLVADKNLNAVYAIHKKAFAPGAAYTAADGAHLVGALDMSTGFITPIVTGLSDPGGLVFVDTSGAPQSTAIACGVPSDATN